MVPGLNAQKFFLTEVIIVDSLREVARWLASAVWPQEAPGTELGRIRTETGEVVRLVNCGEWPKTGPLLDPETSRIECVLECHLNCLKRGSGKNFFMHVVPGTYIGVALS